MIAKNAQINGKECEDYIEKQLEELFKIEINLLEIDLLENLSESLSTETTSNLSTCNKRKLNSGNKRINIIYSCIFLYLRSNSSSAYCCAFFIEFSIVKEFYLVF